jgi:acyl-coenzyme A thioesterase PaaI-like protein
MSHALFGTDDTISGVASLDIATQFIGVCRGQQPLRVTGRVKRATFKTAFLEADIQDEAGTVVATAQSVAKLSRQVADA